VPRVALVEFAPVDGAAQLVRLPGPAEELDEPAQLPGPAEVDEPARLPGPAEVDEPARLPGFARVDEAEPLVLAADSHAPGDLHDRADSRAVAAPRVLAGEYRDLAWRDASLDPV
jgi:hypothetical protein